jgi:DNA-binding IclR family transcriptional regulator
VVAAVSVSGPLDRMGRVPGRLHSQAVLTAAARLTEALRRD